MPPLFVSYRTATLPPDFVVVLPDFVVVLPVFAFDWPVLSMSSGSHAVSASRAAAATPATTARLVNMAASVRPRP